MTPRPYAVCRAPFFHRLAPTLLLALLLAFSSFAQSASESTNRPARRSTPQGPRVVSPEVSSDRKITFRILAPKADSVKLSAGDIPNAGQGSTMTKGSNGIWEVTMGPVPSGAFRYSFNVDGVSVIDPRNPLTSESNENTWSLVYVPGAEFLDTKEVPHGSVASVTYYSSSLNATRIRAGQRDFPGFLPAARRA